MLSCCNGGSTVGFAFFSLKWSFSCRKSQLIGHQGRKLLAASPRRLGIQPNAPGSPGGLLRSLLMRETPPGQAGPPKRNKGSGRR